MPDIFSLHPRLVAGSHSLGRLGICHVLLKDNAHFPWFIVVPEVPASCAEWHLLPEAAFSQLTELMRRLSAFLMQHFPVSKINSGLIGNQVPQCHLHVVGRHPEDPAWPGVVWACSEKRPYTPSQVEEIRLLFQKHFPESAHA